MKMKHVAGLMILGGSMGVAASLMNKKMHSKAESSHKSHKMEFAQELGEFTEKTGDTLVKAGKALHRLGL